MAMNIIETKDVKKTLERIAHSFLPEETKSMLLKNTGRFLEIDEALRTEEKPKKLEITEYLGAYYGLLNCFPKMTNRTLSHPYVKELLKELLLFGASGIFGTLESFIQSGKPERSCRPMRTHAYWKRKLLEEAMADTYKKPSCNDGIVRLVQNAAFKRKQESASQWTQMDRNGNLQTIGHEFCLDEYRWILPKLCLSYQAYKKKKGKKSFSAAVLAPGMMDEMFDLEKWIQKGFADIYPAADFTVKVYGGCLDEWPDERLGERKEERPVRAAAYLRDSEQMDAMLDSYDAVFII